MPRADTRGGPPELFVQIEHAFTQAFFRLFPIVTLPPEGEKTGQQKRAGKTDTSYQGADSLLRPVCWLESKVVAMRLTVLIWLPIGVLFTGCQHVSLRNHTERQARTLTTLQYSQILDNLALFIQNPDALPFFSIAGTGVTSNNYAPAPGGGLNWDLLNFNNGPPLFFFDKANVTMTSTFTSNEQWNTSSVLNPDELLLMRCIYQKVAGQPTCDCDCDRKLQAYFAGHPCYLEAMRPGWYGVGRCRDVPKCAVFVGRCGRTYVWVTAEGVDPLTRVTLAILDLATAATPFSIPDSHAVLIKHLTDTAKDLSLILSQYPLKPTEQPGEAYQQVKGQLDLTMAALVLALQNKTAGDVEGMEEITIPHADGKRSMRLTGEMKVHISNLLTLPTPSSDQLLFRPRKNLFNPIQGVLGPPFLPGR